MMHPAGSVVCRTFSIDCAYNNEEVALGKKQRRADRQRLLALRRCRSNTIKLNPPFPNTAVGPALCPRSAAAGCWSISAVSEGEIPSDPDAKHHGIGGAPSPAAQAKTPGRWPPCRYTPRRVQAGLNLVIAAWNPPASPTQIP